MDAADVRRELAARAEAVRAALTDEWGPTPHRERRVPEPARDPPADPDALFPWAAVCLVADDRGRVLYVAVGDHGHLELEPPGGKGEPGERPAGTARREVREETGIEARVTDLLLVETLRFDYGDGRTYPVAQAVFSGERTGGEARAREAGIEAVRWTDPADLPPGAQYRDLLVDG